MLRSVAAGLPFWCKVDLTVLDPTFGGEVPGRVSLISMALVINSLVNVLVDSWPEFCLYATVEKPEMNKTKILRKIPRRLFDVQMNRRYSWRDTGLVSVG